MSFIKGRKIYSVDISVKCLDYLLCLAGMSRSVMYIVLVNNVKNIMQLIILGLCSDLANLVLIFNLH